MKFIHCSDIHLESPLTSLPDPRKAEERRNEILLTFVRMVRYAVKNRVQAVFIVGNLFDTEEASSSTLEIVERCIAENPAVDFMYVPGNPEKDVFLESLSEVPENLKLFQDGTRSFRYPGEERDVVVSVPESPEDLALSEDDINIVLRHDVIRAADWRDRFIDYLALGQYQEMEEGSLGARGRYCHAGCLEGRGFDDCGEKGFIRLDIENGLIDPVFVKAAKRMSHEVEVDITGAEGTSDVNRLISEALSGREIPEEDLVQVVLTGQMPPEGDLNLRSLSRKYEERFYAFRIVDRELLPDIDFGSVEYDVSLKGEFIRLVMGAELPEEEKLEIIRIGVEALKGRRA